MPATKEPRAGHESIAGLPWLARMIDKARLEAAGEIDQYDLEYPCPMDRGLLKQLNLSGDEFQQIAVAAQSDDDIVAELKKRNALPV